MSLVLVASLLAPVSCARPKATLGESDAAPADAGLSDAQPPHALLGPGDTVRGVSIYTLEADLTNQDGTPIKLDTYRGKPVIISMFYSSCAYACPTLISNVKRIEAALDPAVRAETRVLLVSFDPARDTPEVLRDVRARHKVDGARWTFAVANEDTVRDVAAVLGIKYRAADGSFNHSSVVTLLDREGKIDLRADGMGDITKDASARLTELVRAPATP